MFLLLISFVAGVLTVLAPCILPLLPVIVGRSITDETPSSRRLFVVVTSLSLSIVVFTLLLKASALLIDIPQDFWKWISGGIIFLFGLTMVFPNIWEKFTLANRLSVSSNRVLGKGYQKNSIWGDVIIGASLGPIFSACSPTYFVILATVLPVSFSLGILYLLVYVFGLALALVIISILGKKIMVKVGRISDPKGRFKKVFGIIFIIVAIGIISGYDKKIQIDLLDAGFLDVTKIEQRLLEKNENKNMNDEILEDKQEDIRKENNIKTNFFSIKEKNKKYVFAPDISTPDGFINTDGKTISINEFKGKKVVLLDIWTYSCINCQRTIPYLNEWHKKYEDDGLVIIGLHTPEFAFEKIQKNVEKAVKDFDIKYPVVLDNDFSTWRAYENQYWPRKYLIDIDGYIVYDHAGEGDYKETEIAIQKALKERTERLEMENKIESSIASPENVIVVNGRVGSPEIYFGAWRNLLLGNGVKNQIGIQDFSLPNTININTLYFNGKWNIQKEYAENINDADIVFKYNSKNIYFVAGSKEGVEIEIYQDDVFIKKIIIKDEQLYSLVENSSYGEHTIRIKVNQSGLKAFTFTFG